MTQRTTQQLSIGAPTTRMCIRCGQEQPLAEFRKRQRKDGRISTCSTCLQHKAIAQALVRRRSDSKDKPWENIPCPEGMKVCTICLTPKPLSDFGHDGRQTRNRCKICRSALQYIDYDPDFYRNKHLQRKYGITIDEYNTMLTACDAKCHICGIPTKPRPHNYYPLAVDHDHKTGAVRGLLCHKCNIGLGHFNHDPDLLQRAIAYLAVLWK